MASALSPFASASPGAIAAPSNSSIHNNPFLPPADSPPVAPRDPAAATSIEVRRAASSGASAPAKRRDRHGAELAAFQRDRFPNSSRDTRYPDFLEKLLDEFVEAQLVIGRGADVQFTKDSLQNARAKLSVASGTKGWRIWLKEPLFNRFRDLKQSSSPADTTHSEFVELLLDLHDLVEAHEWDKIRHMLTDVSRDKSEHSAMANLPVVPTMASMMPMPHRRHQSLSGMLPRYDTVSAQQNHQQIGLRPFYVGSNGLGSVHMPDKEVNVILTQPPPSMESNWVDFGDLVGSPNLAELSIHNGNAGVPPEFATNFSGLSSTSADGLVKRSHTSPGNARTRGISRSASQVPGDMLNRTKSLTNANKKTRDGASSAPIPAQRRPSLRSVSGSSLREDGILPPAFYGHRRTGSSLSTTSIRSNSSASGIFYPMDSPVMRPMNELPQQPQWPADSELMMQGLEGINTLNLDDAVAYMEHQHRQQQHQQPHNHQSTNLDVHQSQAVPTFLTTPPTQTLPLIVDYQANPIAASPFPQQFTATGPDSGMFPHSAMGTAGSNSIMRAPSDHQYTTLGVVPEPVPAAGSAIMTDSLTMTSSTSATGTPGTHNGMDLEPTPSLEAMYEDLRTTLNSGEAAAHFSKQRPPPPQNLQEQQRQIAQHRLQQHEDAVNRQQQQIQQHQQRQAFERQQQTMTRQQIADQVQMQFQLQMQHQQQQLQQQNQHQQHLQQQHRDHQVANEQFMAQARADAVDLTVSNMDSLLPPPVFSQPSLNLPPHQAPPRSSSAVNGLLQGAFTPMQIAEPLPALDSGAPMFSSPMAGVGPPPPSNVVAPPPPVAPAADPPQQHQPQQLPAQQHSGWRFRSGTGSSSSSAVSPLPPPITTSGLPAGASTSPASAGGAASPNGRSKRISKILNRLSFVKGGSNNSSANTAPLASPPLATGAVIPAGP
ncbi:hypothetical protein HDU88_002299 [Geranomyces variabilis]|nr:hypothetical protein HDU88_002299 [Geranomyces variabilis]